MSVYTHEVLYYLQEPVVGKKVVGAVVNVRHRIDRCTNFIFVALTPPLHANFVELTALLYFVDFAALTPSWLDC